MPAANRQAAPDDGVVVHQRDSLELNALQCQRRGDVSGEVCSEAGNSRSRSFAARLNSLADPRCLLLLFLESACCAMRYWTLPAALVRTDAWVTLPSGIRRGCPM